MVSLIWTLVIILIVSGLLWWLISMIPTPAPPFPGWIIRVIFACLVVLFVIYALLGHFRVPLPGL